MMRRLVRSPFAPKITSTAGGALRMTELPEAGVAGIMAMTLVSLILLMN